MTNRNNAGRDDTSSVQFEELNADDVFLTELSRGVDVSDGTDPLAEAFIALRDEVHADIPPAPTLADLGITAETVSVSDADTVVAPAVNPRGDVRANNEDDEASIARDDATEMLAAGTDAADGADVIDFHQRAARRGIGRIASAFIGAAAATLVIAAGGSAIYAAKEGSALYGLNQQLFGRNPNHAAVVELASKLEEVNDRTANGDVAGAQELLQQAQDLVNKINAREQQEAEDVPERVSTKVSTTTVTTTQTPEPVAPATATVTVTVEQAPPAVIAPPQTRQPQPSGSQAPSTTALNPINPGEPSATPTEVPIDPPLQLPENYQN